MGPFAECSLALLARGHLLSLQATQGPVAFPSHPMLSKAQYLPRQAPIPRGPALGAFPLTQSLRAYHPYLCLDLDPRGPALGVFPLILASGDTTFTFPKGPMRTSASSPAQCECTTAWLHSNHKPAPSSLKPQVSPLPAVLESAPRPP